MGNFLSPFFIISSLCTFLLGIWVYSINLRNKIYFAWFLFCFSVACWSFGLGILTFVNNPKLAEIFYFVHYFGAIPIPIAFLYFVRAYFLKDSKLSLLIKVGVGLWVLQLYWFVVGELVGELTPKWAFTNYTNPGKFYVFYMLYFSFYVTYSFILMLRTYASNIAEKSRKIFFIIATAIGFSAGSSAFLLVYFDQLPPYGILVFPLFPIITTYSIIRHAFLDIEVIIKKTLVFAGLSSFVFACFSIPLFMLPAYFPPSMADKLQVWFLIIAGMAVAGLVGPLNQFLINATDKYLFQKKINYRVLLREASEYLAHVDSLNKQARTIVSFLLQKARIASASVYAFTTAERDVLQLKASRPRVTSAELQTITLNHPIVKCFANYQGPLEINALKEKDSGVPYREGLNDADVDGILKLMNDLDAEAAIPCFAGEAVQRLARKNTYLKAIVFLGHQKSDEPYSDEDLDVFFTLGQESSIAFENARLYDEAVERTKMLAETNKELEDANKRLQVTQASLIVAEKNATMVNMAKAIGHEVNNPLSIVQFKAQRSLLKTLKKNRQFLEELKVDAEEKNDLEGGLDLIEEDLKKIVTASGRIGGVIQTLTGILREPSGEMAPLSPLILVQEAKEATRFSTYDENLSGCDIIVKVEAHEMILGDTHRLLQVFINLFKNAYEAMEEAGVQNRKIIVDGRVDPDDRAMMRIDVTDNGPGIPPEIMDKIWRQDFSTKTKKDEGIGAVGQGQGLFVCKHMIESVHKGSLLVDSVVGEGTTFIIKLPRVEMESE